MYLRHLTLACLLACLSGCLSIGVVSAEVTVTSTEGDTEIVLRSFETKPVMHDLLGFHPLVWPIELVYDFVLPWYALFSDELDVRWGPGGALLAVLPGVTIIPHLYPPMRWMNRTLTWPDLQFAELLAAARIANERPDVLLDLWRRGNKDKTVLVLDVLVVAIRTPSRQP